MIAHLYILAESFSHNEQYNLEQIEEKIKRLAEDVKVINRYSDTNLIYTNYNDLYRQTFAFNHTIEDFICRPKFLESQGFDRDIIIAFQNIFQKSKDTTITSNEVRTTLLDWTDENNCHGLIAFHEVEGLDTSLQLIYGIDGWYTFRRYFLSIYPKNPAFFIHECTKYFPTLCFHERNITSIKAIFNNTCKRIIYHLSALNDKFRNCQEKGLNRQEVLNKFTSIAKLDQPASLEGDASRKDYFTFSFLDDNNVSQKVCCEPHLKLCFNDNYPGDSSFSTDRRIYFHEGIETISNGKILIGHIGRHL